MGCACLGERGWGLYKHCKENCEDGTVLLDSFLDGILFRDQYYYGIELILPPPETCDSNTEERTSPFIDDE
jgi:hypothetical protein